MKDKLTKKQIKIDYVLVVMALGLENDFLIHQCDSKGSKVRSANRQARYFLMNRGISKDEISVLYHDYFSRGIKTAKDLLNEYCRIAQDHSCWEYDFED